jgi:hypothetical protein
VTIKGKTVRPDYDTMGQDTMIRRLGGDLLELVPEENELGASVMGKNWPNRAVTAAPADRRTDKGQ